MGTSEVRRGEVFGFVRPYVDAHTLGVATVEQLLHDCGYRTVIADARICEATGRPSRLDNVAILERWIKEQGISRLGFSYRLDPAEGAELFGRLLDRLRSRRLLSAQGGPLRALYFAGLPAACAAVKREHGDLVGVFVGDETPAETLERLGIPSHLVPREISEHAAYDEARSAFGRDLVRSGRHLAVGPVDRTGYAEFGTASDTLAARVGHGKERGLPPLMRAHVGPYEPNRARAVQSFLDWTRQLAGAGLLDVLSVGTSQLTQSDFGKDWGDKPNGGGVPINSEAEFRAVWQAARPMLVRTYAGTRNIPVLARMYEETIHIAWHALSFWWFCLIDGRGPHTVLENLREHVETLRVIADTGKPFEPNIPHHFAFRGADDVTYIVSSVLAARTAKRLGVRRLVLQTMLNTPKYTWGIQDLAKARALLALVRELEDERYTVYLQPRAGLDYFSPDLDKAKAQLAAVTALMDDIEPDDPTSPPIIHVVSYSEASHLADPTVVNESVQITRAALAEYRRLRASGKVEDMARNREVIRRTDHLLAEARAVLEEVEASIPDPYSPEGLYRAFWAGFLPVPYLWEGREEFRHALAWRTQPVNGGVAVVDEQGKPIPARARARVAAEIVRSQTGPTSG